MSPYPEPLHVDSPEVIALALKVSPMRRGGILTHWLITVECPHGCRRPHVHGSGGPQLRADHGSRSAHCRNLDRSDYTVIVPAALLELAAQ